MFYRNSHDNSRNFRIVSLAAGLALVAAAVIGGNDLLKEKGSSNSTSGVTPRIERVSPQFGSMADAALASQGIRAPSQFGTAADAVFAAESVLADVAVIPNAAIDGREQALGLGQPAVGQSFGTAADAVFAAESLVAGATDSLADADEYFGGVYIPYMTEDAFASEPVLNDYLGIGQPGEGSNSQPQQFGTMADADYASR